MQKVTFKEGIESDKIIFSNKELNDRKNPLPIHSDAKDEIKENFDLPPSIVVTQKSEKESFLNKHERWLRGVQLLDELADCSDQLAETIFAYILAALVKEINDQYHLHPEWTDVLMEEKRSLTDSLKALGKE